jgi:D-alanine-D-alanine ligase
LRVAVLAGGRSSEHVVSLESAKSVLDGLEAGGHDCAPIVIGRDGVWRSEDPRHLRADGQDQRTADPDGTKGRLVLEPAEGLLEADVVFPVLHGPFGEDGTVQGLLECLDVPYVGAGVLASAICMDKATFKRLMAERGLPQVRYAVVLESQWQSDPGSVVERSQGIHLPQFVKPARLGSSFGISKVSHEDELPVALENAFGHDPCALIEAAAIGREVECSVIGNDEPVVSEPGEVVTRGEWYDYESKYSDGGMELVVPAPITGSQRERIRRLAAEAYLASSCTGLARVDFFVTDQQQVLVNELNTIPGFTSTSVFAKLFEASGIGYVELLDRLIAYALERYERQRAHHF